MLTRINQATKRRKGQRGFTLIELLLVVAILAVLAFLAIPAIASTIRNARTRTCGANERTVEQGIWRWYADQVAAGRTVTLIDPTNTLFLNIAGTAGDPPVSVFNSAFVETNLDPIAGYFTPGGLPECPFEATNTYAVLLTFVQSGLDDVIVQCTGTDGWDADPITGHPRAADRTRNALP